MSTTINGRRTIVGQEKPFADNAEYLEAQLREYQLLLECATLRRQVQFALSPGLRGRQGNDEGDLVDPGLSVEELQGQLARCVEDHQQLKGQNECRLALSAQRDLPFRDMAIRCGLNRFEQDVLWLLFFKAASPDFRQQYEGCGLDKFGHEFIQEIYIGNILQLLCPGALAQQIEVCRHFSIDAPLLAHHLVRFGRVVHECTSILQVEIQLPQQVAAWISSDQNAYAFDQPFEVMRPEDLLEKVVLPQEQLNQVLRLIDNHDGYLDKKKALGLGRLVTYGRAMVILEYGPPGTGKTLLARALACHTGRPLVLLNSLSSSKEATADNLSEQLATLFRQAQLLGGIVFIDECEQWCMETNPVLRPLLIELEQTDALVIMATNRPELLAPSLDRRFTLRLPFAIPDAQARLRIWQNHLEGVPLAPGADLQYLSATFPFSGGYIKNAVLAAVHAALSSCGEEEFLVTQEELVAASQMQVRHHSRYWGHTELRFPRFSLDQSLLPAHEAAQVERLATIARNHRIAASQWLGDDTLIPHPERGFKMLFCGDSYAASLRVAEALAGTLAVPISQTSLRVALTGGERRPDDKERVINWDCRELFAAVSSADNLLLITDPDGLLGRPGEWEEQEEMQQFMRHLKNFSGLAVVVSACRNPLLPAWAQVFHERLCFGPLGAESQELWWRALLGDRAPHLQLESLAVNRPLTPELLQSIVHRARLLAVAEGIEVVPQQEQLAAAIAALGSEGRQGLLFG